ncbi:hypothetical protein [Acidiphilium sp.]|uniref:hypothetical protein n=1 Tax=Acidiphilium sp. TaxID=527 RepID=UPI003D003C58
MTHPVNPETAQYAVSDTARTSIDTNAARHRADLDMLEFALNMLGIAVDMMLAQSDPATDPHFDTPAARTHRENIAAIRHACGLVENRGTVALRSGRDLINTVEGLTSA